MDARVQKWGNSLALRIPRSVAQDAQIQEGTKVQIAAKEGRLVVEPKRSKKYKLKSLLARVRKENLHQESTIGKRVGKEVW